MWQSHLKNWETPEWGSSRDKAKQKIIGASSWMFTKDDKKGWIVFHSESETTKHD